MSEEELMEEMELTQNQDGEVALFLGEDELVLVEGILHHVQEVQMMVGSNPTEELLILTEKFQRAIEFLEGQY